MRLKHRRWTWAIVLLPASLASSPAQGQIWRQLIPTVKSSDAPGDDYGLTQQSGPWLIVAASFSGDGAEAQARELAYELRHRFRLRAYVHEMNFDFSDETPGRGIDEYGAPVRRRYQRGDQVRELSVLIGDYSAIDHPEAQQMLERVKTLHPDALNVDVSKTAQSMAHVRRFEDILLEKLGKPRKRGPMSQAFFTRNPLLPREYFVPQGIDPFVIKMNEGVEHSLLDCPGAYTVQVATFRGKTILQTSARQDPADTSFWNRKKKVDDNPLVEAAENAHLLAEELRAHGFEAYEFHDRTESIVTIGSFAQAAQRLPDGRVLPVPGIQRIIQTFGAAFDTPADPLTDIGNDLRTQRLVDEQEEQFNLRLSTQQAQAVPGMNPKHVKIWQGSGKRRKLSRIIPMDVHPHAIEVPKRTVSGAYSG
jgi:hypothetical protein